MKTNRQTILILLTSSICLFLSFIARPKDQNIFFAFAIIGALSAVYHIWKMNR